MTEECWNAIPHVGIGEIRFGMKPDDVVDVLGRPDDETTHVDGAGDAEIEWFYKNKRLFLSFSSNDSYRLGSITFESPKIFLDSFIPVLADETELLQRLEGLQLEDSFDDIEAKDYWSEELSASFWIVRGKVERVTIFPQFANDAPVWPEGEDVCCPTAAAPHVDDDTPT